MVYFIYRVKEEYMNKVILFTDEERLAKFLAEIIRQGLSYKVDQRLAGDGDTEYLVTLLGGY